MSKLKLFVGVASWIAVAVMAAVAPAAEPLMPTSAVLNSLAEWKPSSGSWTMAAGHLRGSGPGSATSVDALPTDGELAFTLRTEQPAKVYVSLVGQHVRIDHQPGEGDWTLVGDTPDVIQNLRGDPVSTPAGGEIRFTVQVQNGHVRLTINGHVLTAECKPVAHYHLRLHLHPHNGEGTADFYDFRLGPTQGGPPPGPAPTPAAADDPGAVADTPAGVIAVPAACRRPAAATTHPGPPPPSTRPADPSTIARPECADEPKPLVRPLTSVTGMAVVIAADGEETGATTDLIAAVRPNSRHGDTAGVSFVMRGEGDAMMRTALQEAVRAVQVRYPVWAPGYIDLSFGDKFNKHAGPSAGTAFALLVLSTLEDVPLDPLCAVTGDITVDWKVRPVRGVAAKLRGAALDGRTAAVIPAANAQAFTDMGLLYGHPAWWEVQVFACGTLQEAQAVARQDRSPPLAEAMAAFATVAAKLDAGEAAALRDPQNRRVMQHVLAAAPNHLSAKAVLALCDGTAPKYLSIGATEYKLSIIFYPYAEILKRGTPVTRDTVTPELLAKTRRRINALRPIADRSLLPLLASYQSFAEVLDQFARGQTTGDAVVTRGRAIDARLNELGSDPNFTEKEIRDGY